jgi:hypothetical protein
VEYACEKDANQAAEKWLEEHQMYQFKQLVNGGVKIPICGGLEFPTPI